MTIAVPEVTPGLGDEITGLLLRWILAQESPNTRMAYARDVDPGLIPLLRDRPPKREMPFRPPAVPPWRQWCEITRAHPVSDVNRTHVDTYARAMEAAGLSLSTRHRKLSAVSSWYTWLCEEGFREISPAAHVKRPRLSRSTPSTPGLTTDQARALLDAADNAPRSQRLRNAALIAVLITTAIRVSSAVGADVEDLGMDRGHQTLQILGKGEKIRKKILTPLANVRLQAYLASRTDLEKLPAVPGEPGAPAPRHPLFATANGNRMYAPEVWRIVRSLGRRAGFAPELVQHLGPHAMKHTGVSIALDEGAQIHYVQDLADHESLATTEVYVHTGDLLDNSPSYLIAAAIAGAQ